MPANATVVLHEAHCRYDDRRAALIHIHTRDEIHGVVNDVLQRDDETALKGWGG